MCRRPRSLSWPASAAVACVIAAKARRVELRFETENKPGALAKVAAAVAECNSNIDSVNYKERDARISVMVFCIEVKDRKHLADIIRRTRRLSVVYSVERV